MKISELIEKLESVKQEIGDVDVISSEGYAVRNASIFAQDIPSWNCKESEPICMIDDDNGI